MRWLLLLALAGCHAARTEVVVFVENDALVVPGEIDAVRVLAHDRSVDANFLQSPDEPLCLGGQTSNCLAFPISVTLHPGSGRPHDVVEVRVQALRGPDVVIDNAATFTFNDGQSQRLDFILYPRCLGTDCAIDSKACGADGQCGSLTPQPLDRVPDLSFESDLAVGDLNGSDLAGSDLAGSDLAVGDLAGADLTALAPSLTRITPPGLALAGGAVALEGSGFQAGATVSFGASAASNVVVASPTRITATAPAGASCGRTSVTVTNPGGLSVSRADLFSYGCATLAFSLDRQIMAGNAVSGVALGDLDDDTKLDAMFSATDNKVYVARGNGLGQLVAKPTVSTAGTWPQDIQVGRITSSGRVDALVAIYNANLQVLRNDGNFSFTAMPLVSIGEFPRYLALADFTGSGLGVVVGRFNGGSVVVPADPSADGGFGLARPDTLAAQAVAAGILDGDSLPDYASVDHCKVNVFLNQPGGSDAFPSNISPNSYSTDKDPYDVKLGDLNGDGHLDLIVANAGETPNCSSGTGGNVSTLINNGDGTFVFKGTYPAGAASNGTRDLALGDFDGDGRLDVAAVNYFDSTIGILLGNGDGSLKLPQSFGDNTNTPAPNAIASGDLNGDGLPDLVTGNNDGSRSVLLNTSH